MEKMITLNEAFDTEVVKNIIAAGGEVYLVGGCVRDFLLKKPAKDIDIIVRLIEPSELANILVKTGKYDLVGNSFGVLKYIDDLGFELDIALPRKDFVLEGEKGHKAIDAQSDPYLSIEEDLMRRDFTCNSLALNKDFDLIDPFNGAEDLDDKILRAVNKKAFIEDPLRILRAIRFAAVLGFKIEKETLELIKENITDLQFIPGERKLGELEKIVAAEVELDVLENLLNKTNSSKEIFGVQFKSFPLSMKLTTMADLLWFVPDDVLKSEDKANHFKKFLCIDSKTENFLNAFHFFELNFRDFLQVYKVRNLVFLALQKAKDNSILKSIVLKNRVDISKFEDGTFPTHFHQIKMTGGDLMDLGLRGAEIKRGQEFLLHSIFKEEVKNNGFRLLLHFRKKYKNNESDFSG